eukprot:Gb_15297 [translate_table: standard]
MNGSYSPGTLGGCIYKEICQQASGNGMHRVLNVKVKVYSSVKNWMSSTHRGILLENHDCIDLGSSSSDLDKLRMSNKISPIPSPSGVTDGNPSRVGLVIGVATAASFVVLVIALILAVYVCSRLYSMYHGSHMSERSNSIIISRAPLEQGGMNAVYWTAVGGLDQASIDSYPLFAFCKEQTLPHSQNAGCSICLGDFKERELLRLLPDCHHCFHSGCIDAWLRLHASCPMCRSSPSPTSHNSPVSTPRSHQSTTAIMAPRPPLYSP